MATYYTLVAALPWLPSPQNCQVLPITAISLQQRLSMLSAEDAENLQRLQALFFPAEEQMLLESDQALVSRWQELLSQIVSEALQQVAIQALELKTLLAAFRMRQSGVEHAQNFQGAGRWLGRIKQHWFEPAFGLEGLYPPALEIQRLLEKRKPLLLERYLQQQLWQWLQRLEDQYPFEFEAVAAYVLRWQLLEQSLQSDGEAALARFNQATTALLRNCGLEQISESGSCV